ncbi:hypothetical protein, variant 2 [Aphanomyces astaci]|uniref:Calpain catalytic domain-containing protein n=1 Tax=Aphanomyces astaci TaxID=112090 RepID=W4FGZ1_APHAT|nr:hypothetical protein, variant 2 [Aphanomyces astaci]ETV66076.1 hypothetical protein, variant 2 [Aphanomyces astaci]|eukprot:XP_009844409.1 hypothetical protein, variant 2 [Aphanomyces astaci]
MELVDGVMCTTTLTESPWQLEYAIDNMTGHEYDVELDFAGSSNLAVAGSATLSFRATLRPYAIVIATVARVRPLERCAVCINYHVHRTEGKEARPSPDESHLVELTGTFVDPSFPPTQACLGDISSVPSMRSILPTLTWAHVSSILHFPSAHPSVLPPSTARLSSSSLCGGDPAFVSIDMKCALQIVGDRMGILTRLFPHTVPRHGLDTHERFAVLLHRHGQPITVEIDGFVPCISHGGGPVVMKCRRTMQCVWPMLVHKALAKLYGGYSHLCQVSTMQLLHDMVGYPSVKVTCNPANLHSIVQPMVHRGHLVGVTFPSASSSRHGIMFVSGDDRAITLRHYPSDARTQLVENSANCCFAHRHDDVGAINACWYFPMYPQRLVRRVFVQDAAACASAAAAMFILSIPSPASVMISLTYAHQVTDMGMSLLTMEPTNQIKESLVEVPSTIDTHHPSACTMVASVEAGEYVLAVKPVQWSHNDDKHTEKGTTNTPVMQRMFDMLDWDMDHRLDIHDMARFMAVYEDGLSMSTSAFEWLLEHFDSDGVGLTLKGLEEFYMANGRDEATGMTLMEQSHPCCVHVHCSSQVL